MSKADLTAEQARKLLAYDPETGQLTWRVNYGKRRHAGKRAGCVRGDGRHVVRVYDYLYYVHRIIWLLEYGVWPAGHIDHMNGNPMDNRLMNLRDVPRHVNAQNQRKARRTSKTGLLGASPAGCPGEIGRYVAFIGWQGGRKNLGYFDTPEEAHAAYVAAKRQLHIGCTI